MDDNETEQKAGDVFEVPPWELSDDHPRNLAIDRDIGRAVERSAQAQIGRMQDFLCERGLMSDYLDWLEARRTAHHTYPSAV